MLPSGSRFADAARIRGSDVASLSADGVMTLRVHQAKNIRKRSHQRWLQLRVPRFLCPHLRLRLSQCHPDQPLVQMTYRAFLSFLKKFLNNKSVTTYSVRRTVFEMLRRRVATIEDMMKVTLHRNADQLRWYLEAPLMDEVTAMIKNVSLSTRPFAPTPFSGSTTWEFQPVCTKMTSTPSSSARCVT
eukprot:PhM_4_TR2388/c3_g3_i1/m.10355